MRVTGPSPQSRASPGRGIERPGGSAAFPMLGGAVSATACGPAVAAPAAAALGMLMALQSLPDATERRRRAMRRGRDLLERLEQLHLALLEGTLPSSVLDGLRRHLADDAGKADDRSLQLLLAEIEVRAAVELAKLEPVMAER
ncbi:MAG: flagellar assembly protein FliX [Geminicoccaceae bacterium]